MGRRTWMSLLVPVGALVACIPAAIAGVASASALWTNVAWLTAALAAMSALWRAAARTDDATGPGWRLLGHAGTAWFAGQALWSLWSLGLPVHVLADAAWLAFAPLSAVGLARIASINTRGRDLVYETVPVIAATGALITALLFNDITTSTLGPVARWISLGYPITYAVVPVMTVQVLLTDRVRMTRRPDVVLIALGIATQALGFTLWAPRLLHQTYVVGHSLDLTWTAGLILIAVGALLHDNRMPALESGGERRFASVLPGTLFVVLLGLLLLGTVLDWAMGMRLVLEGGSLGVGVLIGARIAALSRRQSELLASERRTRTALERTADELSHVALHDSLTKLPNRALFMDRATHALAAARRTDTWTAVLFLDVDDFKRVNDVYGHTTGDALLCDVAMRLSGVVRPTDTVARFGGDEFTVLCPGLVNERHAMRVARRIIDALDKPFEIRGVTLHAAASVGIAFASHGSADAEALVRDADTAMYRAKEHGSGTYEVFDEAVRERAVSRMRIEEQLRRAIDRDELRLAYQPFVHLGDERITGFEALLRWESPELGVLGPCEFIPIAEQRGLMPHIGAWVLDQACERIAELRSARPDLDLVVAVNVSARQVLDPALPRAVRRALCVHDLPASALALEITESDLIADGETVMATLSELRRLGIRLMLDDFGTGFSSLGYLKRFPVDVLKIDKSFVQGLGHDEGDRAIVTAIMGVAQALALEVIAEGVETDEQASALRELGCTLAQGFRFAEPSFEPEQALNLVRAA